MITTVGATRWISLFATFKIGHIKLSSTKAMPLAQATTARRPPTPAPSHRLMEATVWTSAPHGSRLPDHELQRRRAEGLRTACGDHGHWKYVQRSDQVKRR